MNARFFNAKSFFVAMTLFAAPGSAQTAAAPAAQPVSSAPATPAAAAPTTVAPAPGPDMEPLAATPTATGPAAQGAAAAPAPNAPGPLPTIAPDDSIGQPTGRFGLQDQVTDVGKDAAYFHDVWLVPIITAISLLVLALMLYVIVRYRRSANPVPSRTSHNTTIEVIWTVLPVAALVAIAFPSLGLLARQYAPPKADLTIKAIGNQWYWEYEYPDHGVSFVSNMLKEKGEVPAGQRVRTDRDGPRLLAVDDRVVVPVNATVKVIVTSADVLHSFAMPAFWQKMDAVPGRLNETWFKSDKEGVYFGQCSELCGARHAYMPIAIEVVSPARFAAWVATKGGAMPGAAPANADATASSPITSPTAGAAGAEIGSGEALETMPAPSNVLDVVERPAVSTQGATDAARSNQN